MPIDKGELTKALSELDKVYKSSPNAVRTGGVIATIHNFCVKELVSRGLPESKIYPQSTPIVGRKRIRLLGAYMPKEIDV
jgi:hypothetical protein